VRDHADRDLRRRTVERGAQKFAALIQRADDGAGRNVVSLDDIRAVDPGVAGLQARGSSGREFHGWLRSLSGDGAFLRHG